jgi:glycosyltransferase involved in cell wall biosynthesis
VRISVIIPTFNRAATLHETLDGLAHQTWPADDFEVVVVDDGSTDDTPAVANRRDPYRLRYLRQENRGSAAARNYGAVQSQGSLLVFIDDDITLAPDYLHALAAAHDRYPNLVGMGALYPDVGEANTPFARYVLRTTPHWQTSDWVHFTECTSNNLSIEREAFFRLGQWRDVAGDGQTLWGDVEFGYRAFRAGMRCRRCADAMGFHRDYAIRDLPTQCRRMRRAAVLAHALFRVAPELEAELPMFRDMAPPNWSTDRPRQLARKLLRRLSAWPAVVKLEERLIGWLERRGAGFVLLTLLYRWLIGAYIYRGYREGAATSS